MGRQGAREGGGRGGSNIRGGGREGESKGMVGEGTRGGWERRREGEMRRGRREEAMMLCRQRASVEKGRVGGGRVDEGNKR